MLSQCSGDARWPGWKPQIGDRANVVPCQAGRCRGTNDRVPANLMLKLVNRVKKLR